MSKNYKLAFKIAAGVIPVVMAVVGAIYGDVTPVVRDLCTTALPTGSVAPAIEADAGAR